MAETANDMKAHAGTYHRFIGLLKLAVPLIAVIVIIVVLLIS